MAVIVLLLPLIITAGMKGSSVMAENSRMENKLELLLPGILCATIPSDYNEETLKAQAVVVRTMLLATGEEDVELAAEKLKLTVRREWDASYGQAAEATQGEVLFYANKIAQPAYHALSTGRTRSSEEATGEAVPYLQAVDSSWDKECTYYENVAEEDTGKEIEVLDRDSSGYVRKVRYGDEEMTGEEFRRRLSLPSSAFFISKRHGKRILVTNGIGHGLGMSQYGADGIAKEGYDYKRILEYYFKGTEVRQFYE